MRQEVNIENRVVTVDISLWTGQFQIYVDGTRTFNSWKILYTYIVLIIIANLLLIISTIIWYDLGYIMGRDGMKPLFPISLK